MKVFLQVAFPQRSHTSLKHFSFQTVAPCPQAQPISSLSWKKKSHYKSQKDFRLLSTHENLISGTSYGTWTMVQLEIGFGEHKGFLLLMRLLQQQLLLSIFLPHWPLRNLYWEPWILELLIITLIVLWLITLSHYYYYYFLITQGTCTILKPRLVLTYKYRH